MNILQYTYTSNKGIMGLLLLIDNYVMIVPVLYWVFFLLQCQHCKTMSALEHK